MIPEKLRRFLGRKTVVYDASFFSAQWFTEWEMLREVLFALIRSQPRWKSILDFGCGPGVMIDYMNDRGYRYVGCDSSAEARKLYLTHYGKCPEEYVAHPENAGNRRFDLLLSFDVFEHMPDEKIEALLSATRDIPELLVNISRERRIPGHINIKSDRRWIGFLAAQGFEHDVETTTSLRRAYAAHRPGSPDLWDKNLFLFRRTTPVAGPG